MGDRKLMSVLGFAAVCGLLAITGHAQAQDAADPLAQPLPSNDPAQAAAESGAHPPPEAPVSAPMDVAPEPTNDPAPNAIFIEGLGAGLAYSINYERHVVPELAVRLGFSYLSVSASASSGDTSAEASSAYLTFPITAAYVGLRGLEVGGGVTLAYASGSASTVGASASGSGIAPLGTLAIGYRLHPRGRAGFQFRVGAMALVGKGLSLSSDASPDDIGILPWLYISFGAGF